MHRIIAMSAWLGVLAAGVPPGSAGAETPVVPYGYRTVESIARIDQVRAAHRQGLLALRREVLDQQARDGGALTEGHRALFQARLDRSNALFHRNLVNVDPLTVDSLGNPVTPRAVPLSPNRSGA